MAERTLAGFLARHNPDGKHPVTEVIAPGPNGTSPFIIIRDGEHTVIVNPIMFDDHLSVDIHPFIAGEAATASVYGMTDGRQYDLPDTGTTSFGRPSAGLIAVLVGEQARS